MADILNNIVFDCNYMSTNITWVCLIHAHCVCGLGVPLHLPLTGTHYPAPPTTTTIAITIVGQAYSFYTPSQSLWLAVPIYGSSM